MQLPLPKFLHFQQTPARVGRIMSQLEPKTMIDSFFMEAWITDSDPGLYLRVSCRDISYLLFEEDQQPRCESVETSRGRITFMHYNAAMENVRIG